MRGKWGDAGCLIDSCRECDSCQQDLELYCLNGNIGTYGGIGRDGKPTAGGYWTHIVVDQDFA